MDNTQRPTRTRHVVVFFMVTLAMVTYLDRACIGVMAPKISAEFGLDEGQMSWVFFSFIFAYALFEIPTARWADTHGAKSVLIRIVTWWSAFTMITAGAMNSHAIRVCCHAARRSRERASLRTPGLSIVEAVVTISQAPVRQPAPPPPWWGRIATLGATAP